MVHISVQARPPASSRELLLDAGERLLRDRPSQAVRRGITARLVCTAAGVARRTFYDHFETVDDYLAALAASLEARLDANERVQAGHDVTVVATNGDLRALIADVVADTRDSRHDAASWSRALQLIDVAGPPREPAPVAARLVAEMERLGFRRDLALSLGDVVGPIDALLDGAARGDRATSRDAWCSAIEHVLLSMSDAQGDDETPAIDARRARVRAAWAQAVSDTATPNLRRMVVEAVEEIVVERGAHAVSIGAVSARTGFSRAAISRHVGDASGMLAALVDEVVPGLDMLLARDVASRLAPNDVIRLHVRRVVRTVRERPPFGAALAAVADRERTSSLVLSSARRDLNQSLARVLGRAGTPNPEERALAGERLAAELAVVLASATDDECCDVIERCLLA